MVNVDSSQDQDTPVAAHNRILTRSNAKVDPIPTFGLETRERGLLVPANGIVECRGKGSFFDKGKSGVIRGDDGGKGDREYSERGRSPRSVWTGSSALFGGAHFAVMPLWLAEKPLKASISPVGCCPECGAQWARRVIHGKSEHHCRPGCGCPNDPGYDDGDRTERGWGSYGGFLASSLSSDEFVPTCDCSDEDGRPLTPVPSSVFDPFSGSCTSLVAARNVGARSLGAELSERYCKLGIERIETS